MAESAGLRFEQDKIYLFENSAHSPIFEEQNKVSQIIKNDILKNTK